MSTLQFSPLLGALVGLVRSTEGNEHLINRETDRLVIQGLCNLDEKDSESLLEAIHREKFRLVPKCSSCAAPCGRNNDLSPEDWQKDHPDILAEKLALLTAAQKLANQLQVQTSPSPSALDKLYNVLFALGLKDLTLQDLELYRI